MGLAGDQQQRDKCPADGPLKSDLPSQAVAPILCLLETCEVEGV